MSDLEIPAARAFHLIASVGIRHVEVYPAQDHVTLQDGRVLVFDEGGYEHERSWMLCNPAKS